MDNSKYEAVRAKIVEACWSVGEEDTIRLSHVLRAIRKADNERKEFYLFGKLERDMSKIEGEVCSRFNLEKDDLSLERPETIDFLFNILCE